MNEYDYDIDYVRSKYNNVAEFLGRLDVYNNGTDTDGATIHSGLEDVGDYIPIRQLMSIVHKYI